MGITSYLETLPLYGIARYASDRGGLKNGVAFIGCLRQSPADKNNVILITDPLGGTPKVMEFKAEDILAAEEARQTVTESGNTAPLVKLWIRKGARGVILEPFEVDDPIRFIARTPG